MAKAKSPPEAAAEWTPIDELRPWSENPRKNEKAIAAVMRSLERWGWGAPIVARREDGEIVAGHTRFEAARRLGMDRVPVRFVDLDREEAHRLARADNRLAEISSWDRGMLADQLLGDFDIGGIDDIIDQGWTQDYIDKLVQPEGAIEELEFGDVRDEFWLSVRGPMPRQADVLDKLRAALEKLPGVEVDVGTTEF